MNKRLKICYVISGDLWAGAEVMAYQLIKELKRIGEPDILTVLLNDGALAEKLRGLGTEVRIVDEKKNSFLQMIRSLQKVVGNYKPDVIHSHRYKENLLAYWVARRLSRRPGLVTTQHGMPESFHGLSNLRHSLILKHNFHVLRKHFDKVVVVSQDIEKNFCKSLNFPKSTVKVIHNGIDIPDRTFQKMHDGMFVIGSCGRLFPVKDYPLLIEVARDCKERDKNIRFELAGDGPEYPRLKALTEKYGLDGMFRFRGHLDDMAPFYRELDLFINTSIHEGIPMSVLEAMSFGLPVVAPNVGGLPEIIKNNVEGFLIDERNPSLFAEKCKLLSDDDELWERMSKAAREKVERCFSVESMAKKYYDLYLSLCEGV